METLLDIPDDVLQRAAMKAAREGVSLKEFVVRILQRDLEPAEMVVSSKPWEALRGTGEAGISPEESPWEYKQPPEHDPIWESSAE